MTVNMMIPRCSSSHWGNHSDTKERFVSVKHIVVLMLSLLPAMAMADGRIAVLNQQQAILNTDAAQKRFKALESTADYKEEFQQLQAIEKEGQDLLAKLKKDAAVMSDAQKQEMGKKLNGLQSDAQHLAKKLQEARQQEFQLLLRDLGPRYQKVVSELIKSEGIGLLLNQEVGVILHVDSSYDITAKVTDKLNRGE
ncbi:MAG: OmpH family outer membrane protein [Gammaproteobacteria bacterium]|nr:MAG: OmpH family outer membrane protein [Gammaproteobacteria bacterium]